MKRWPLIVIAAPAAVAVWSGWVGLGEMCGFGIVHPLPGIAPGVQLNTAITLPIGVEAYGTYAISRWLTPDQTPAAARTFARWSALASLALGMVGQVAYHLLAAAHVHQAPWPVVVIVSCLPVVTLGLAAALMHLLRAVPEAVPAGSAVPEAVPEAAAGPELPHPDAVRVFAAEIAARTVPGIRRIRAELHIGQDRAREVQAHLKALTETI
jgi:hypothetical protein